MNSQDGRQVGKQNAPEQRSNPIVAQLNKIDQIEPIKTTNLHAQRKYIIKCLREHGSINTLQFRELGVISPAPRILELREQSYPIEKILINVADNADVEHKRIALYYLKSSVNEEVMK